MKVFVHNLNITLYLHVFKNFSYIICRRYATALVDIFMIYVHANHVIILWLRIISLHHRFQSGSGAHPASYPMVTRVCLPGGKAAGE